ncbi:GNAT family N-acetyltransferase [Flavobacterium wongokense]|uniref:GNAT family N-acetyltransferase n=1 Tax=Flavobacterium wongokense TaxID=2910674 RepID=UPI001F2C4446|nr:GNAT family N-acetyltransferase [Flavobacterium sp. WG47]MCF6132890.1 GNAT family N-acetyltransferase [Flavobacterium sp. WG47]
MITIQNNTDPNFSQIRAIAKEVWPIAYGAILSQEQLDYMMEMMYSVEALQTQFNEKGHHFILAIEEEAAVGFASYEFNYNQEPKTKIHKIYILSNQQGKGTGRILIDYITESARKNNQKALLLNVNKNNIAQHFYKKLGFDIVLDEVIDIGNGYVMDDYVMEKSI